MGYKDEYRLPDGYEWIGDGPAIRLTDPDSCPAGHPFRLVRRSHVSCQQHGMLHHEWTCACGQVVWRFEGAFVKALPCR